MLGGRNSHPGCSICLCLQPPKNNQKLLPSQHSTGQRPEPALPGDKERAVVAVGQDPNWPGPTGACLGCWCRGQGEVY